MRHKLLVLALVAWPVVAHAQTPAMGPVFRVNTTIGGSYPEVAASADGTFVVAWREGLYPTPPEDHRVVGRRFDSSGAALSEELPISDTAASDFAIAAHPSDNLVVVWLQTGVETGNVRARGFTGSGQPLGPSFVLSSSPYLTGLDVAASETGSIAAWNVHGGFLGSPNAIYARRFESDGSALGDELQVSVDRNIGFESPAVAIGSHGGFLIVWVGAGTVVGRLLDDSGNPLGGEFHLSSEGGVQSSDVASDGAGGYVVVWKSLLSDGRRSLQRIFYRRFDGTGSPRGPELQVDTGATPDQDAYAPAIATNSSGNFIVVWWRDGGVEIGADAGIAGRLFLANGSPIGEEFEVAALGAGIIILPAVAMNSGGQFLVAWGTSARIGFPDTPRDEIIRVEPAGRNTVSVPSRPAPP